MIDSADSIIMLYSYAGFPEKSWVISDRSGSSALRSDAGTRTATVNEHVDQEKGEGATVTVTASPDPPATDGPRPAIQPSTDAPIINTELEGRTEKETRVKMNVMSGLSIVLTLMSILVAYTCVICTPRWDVASMMNGIK